MTTEQEREAIIEQSNKLGREIMQLVGGYPVDVVHNTLCHIMVTHFAGLTEVGMSEEQMIQSAQAFGRSLPARALSEIPNLKVLATGEEAAAKRKKGMS